MKKLKIAQISPLRLPVPAEKKGGNERIISYITEELVKRGHDVTLFASGDSKTNAKLVPLLEKSLDTVIFSRDNFWWNIFSHSVAFEKASKFDVIHCHWDIMGAFFQKFVKTPVLNTVHYVETPQKIVWNIFEYYKNDVNIAFITENQKKNSPIKFKNCWVVPNGTDTSQFKFNLHPKNHFVWAGRTTFNKNIKEVLALAKASKIELLLAGDTPKERVDYLEKEVKPHLNSKIKHIGELSLKELPEFYGSAKACLYPMGLVKLESMACGTPIIVLDNNKLKKTSMIVDKKTGFIVKNTEEAVDAIKKIDTINRHDCREFVEKNFSIEKMVDEYEKIYYEIIKKRREN